MLWRCIPWAAGTPRQWCLVAASALALAAVAGCGGDDEDAAATTSAGTTSAVSTSCVAADSNLMAPLGIGMKDMQHRLKSGQAVRSEEHEGIYIVSAEIYGPGVDDGTIGTWATRSLGGADAIWTLDDVSKEYSDLRDGVAVAQLSVDDPAVATSRECVEALR